MVQIMSINFFLLNRAGGEGCGDGKAFNVHEQTLDNQVHKRITRWDKAAAQKAKHAPPETQGPGHTRQLSI
jgi:hypothetical protein